MFSSSGLHGNLWLVADEWNYETGPYERYNPEYHLEPRSNLGREGQSYSVLYVMQYAQPLHHDCSLRCLYSTGPSWYLLGKYCFTICAVQLWQWVEMLKCVCDSQERSKLLVSDSTTVVPWECKEENARLQKTVLGFNVWAWWSRPYFYNPSLNLSVA